MKIEGNIFMGQTREQYKESQKTAKWVNLVITLIMGGILACFLISFISDANFNQLSTQPAESKPLGWEFFVSIAASLGLIIFGLISMKTERERDKAIEEWLKQDDTDCKNVTG